MRKILLLVLAFILICFLIPIIFTNRININPKEEPVNANEKKSDDKDNVSINTYNYKNYARIKLLHSETSSVEEMGLDEYLYGVVASEMPANFDVEALRAQAIVARTYTIHSIVYKKKHEVADICDNPNCCQAWISKEDRVSKWNEDERESNWKKIVEAVNSTQGKIITYEGKVIEAFFHANSGGKTETAINVWGEKEEYPYLGVVETARRRCVFTV